MSTLKISRISKYISFDRQRIIKIIIIMIIRMKKREDLLQLGSALSLQGCCFWSKLVKNSKCWKLLNLWRFYCSFYYFLGLLPYSQNVSQHLWLTKGWRVGWAAVGVKLWAWVARLAANHFYESAGGQKKPRDFSRLLLWKRPKPTQSFWAAGNSSIAHTDPPHKHPQRTD